MKLARANTMRAVRIPPPVNSARVISARAEIRIRADRVRQVIGGNHQHVSTGQLLSRVNSGLKHQLKLHSRGVRLTSPVVVHATYNKRVQQEIFRNLWVLEDLGVRTSVYGGSAGLPMCVVLYIDARVQK